MNPTTLGLAEAARPPVAEQKSTIQPRRVPLGFLRFFRRENAKITHRVLDEFASDTNPHLVYRAAIDAGAHPMTLERIYKQGKQLMALAQNPNTPRYIRDELKRSADQMVQLAAVETELSIMGIGERAVDQILDKLAKHVPNEVVDRVTAHVRRIKQRAEHSADLTELVIEATELARLFGQGTPPTARDEEFMLRREQLRLTKKRGEAVEIAEEILLKFGPQERGPAPVGIEPRIRGT